VELHDVGIETLDVEGLLGFGQTILADASRVWFEAVPEQKVRLQRVYFPEGISFDGEKLGTA
jgi:hypothetical protein